MERFKPGDLKQDKVNKCLFDLYRNSLVTYYSENSRKNDVTTEPSCSQRAIISLLSKSKI